MERTSHFRAGARDVFATRRAVCAFACVLAACASDAREAAREFGPPSFVLGTALDAGGPAAPPAVELAPNAGALSFDDCVERQVQERGGMHAVTELACPGAAEACADPPDLSRLARFSNLRKLDLSDRCIADVEPLTALDKLEKLELRGNRVEDIRPLGKLRALRYLGLAGNPLKDTWWLSGRKPFSQLSQLEELNLDGTWIGNIMPLRMLTSLSVLHLRKCDLVSINPLLPLTGLRALHIDGNRVGDLSVLERFDQLEELTADQNYISSIEPLPRLVTKGHLRKVSLDQNCVAACEALSGAGASCAGARSGCEDKDDWVEPAYRSVPVEFVEQFAPKENLPIWSQTQVDDAFELLRTSSIFWPDPRTSCDGRARSATALLERALFPRTTKVFAYGNLRPLTTYEPAGFVGFDWHVAAAARTENGFVVFDLTFAPDRPLPLRAWFERMLDSRGVELNYSCANFHAGNTPRLCREEDGAGVDAQGNFLVDDLEDVQGTLCKSGACL